MGAEKTPQEKLKSHQLVLMLVGNFVLSKGLRFNLDIRYLISRTGAPTPPASSVSAARLARAQLGEADVLTRNRCYTEAVMGDEGRAKGWNEVLHVRGIYRRTRDKMGLGLWIWVNKQHKPLHLCGDAASSDTLKLLLTDTWGVWQKLWAEREAEGQKRQEK